MTINFPAPVLVIDADAVKVLDGDEALTGLCLLFTKCKSSLHDGRRLENISWRLWYREKITTSCYRPLTPDSPEEDGTTASSSTFGRLHNHDPLHRRNAPSLVEHGPLSSPRSTIGKLVYDLSSSPPPSFKELAMNACIERSVTITEPRLLPHHSNLPTPDTEFVSISIQPPNGQDSAASSVTAVSSTAPSLAASPSTSSPVGTTNGNLFPRVIVVNPTPNPTPHPTPPTTPILPPAHPPTLPPSASYDLGDSASTVNRRDNQVHLLHPGVRAATSNIRRQSCLPSLLSPANLLPLSNRATSNHSYNRPPIPASLLPASSTSLSSIATTNSPATTETSMTTTESTRNMSPEATLKPSDTRKFHIQPQGGTSPNSDSSDSQRDSSVSGFVSRSSHPVPGGRHNITDTAHVADPRRRLRGGGDRANESDNEGHGHSRAETAASSGSSRSTNQSRSRSRNRPDRGMLMMAAGNKVRRRGGKAGWSLKNGRANAPMEKEDASTNGSLNSNASAAEPDVQLALSGKRPTFNIGSNSPHGGTELSKSSNSTASDGKDSNGFIPRGSLYDRAPVPSSKADIGKMRVHLHMTAAQPPNIKGKEREMPVPNGPLPRAQTLHDIPTVSSTTRPAYSHPGGPLPNPDTIDGINAAIKMVEKQQDPAGRRPQVLVIDNSDDDWISDDCEDGESSPKDASMASVRSRHTRNPSTSKNKHLPTNAHDSEGQNILDEADRRIKEAAVHDRDMFVKLPKRSYSNLNRTNSGLLSQLMNPDPQIFPVNHPYRRGYSSGDVSTGAPRLGLNRPLVPLTSQREKEKEKKKEEPNGDTQKMPPPPPRPNRTINSRSGFQPSRSVTVSPQITTAVVADRSPVRRRTNDAAGPRLKGRPEGLELEDSSDGEEDTLQVSESVAHQRLAAFVTRHGVSSKTSNAERQPKYDDLPPWLQDEPNRLSGSDARAPQPKPDHGSTSKPIQLAFPYNLPQSADPMTPRVIRHNIIRNEMSESLRQNLLWKRKQDRSDILGPRRQSSGTLAVQAMTPIPPVVQLRERVHSSAAHAEPGPDMPQAQKEKSHLTRNKSWAADEYHYAGW